MNLHFNKFPRWVLCTLQFEKFCCSPYVSYVGYHWKILRAGHQLLLPLSLWCSDGSHSNCKWIGTLTLSPWDSASTLSTCLQPYPCLISAPICPKFQIQGCAGETGQQRWHYTHWGVAIPIKYAQLSCGWGKEMLSVTDFCHTPSFPAQVLLSR